MKLKIISLKEKDVDFAFVDFYTIGHFIFGYIAQLIVYFLFTIILGFPNNPGIFIVISINIGIWWEFFENFYLQKRGFKYDNRIDSFANSLTDVLFVDIGAIVCASISIIEGMFIVSIIVLVVSTALMEILRKITFKNGKEK